MMLTKIAIALLGAVIMAGAVAQQQAKFPVMPEFTQSDSAAWINSTPLKRN
ncbi:MAG: hypothetical protein HKN70_05920, partial [Gammaproteobacteria bacterium]|nr:hypothetical protein [Gammaproteobacteria bacterium]